MRSGTVYSLQSEQLITERQLSVVRLLLAVTTTIMIVWYEYDVAGSFANMRLFYNVAPFVFTLYSIVVWAILHQMPRYLDHIMLVTSVLEIILITYLVAAPAGREVPFYLWYIFYVASVAMRYGWKHSVLALAASIVSFTSILVYTVYCSADPDQLINIPTQLGFTYFLLVLAYLFGQVSERQLSYQASLNVVNRLRAELAVLPSSREIMEHVLFSIQNLLAVSDAFFLPAKGGADSSEEPGLRSIGQDPRYLATFREEGGEWNVSSILNEQSPLVSNSLTREHPLPKDLISRLQLRNIAAAPMMVRGVPIGVIYAANKSDGGFNRNDVQLLELIAAQTAPVVENTILWERLTESAASEERLRIARDLHDNVLQTLAGIKMHLEKCKIQLQKSPDRAASGIDRIHEIATRGLAEVRAYLSQLRLMGPDPSRFEDSIKKAAYDAASQSGFEVSLSFNLPESGLAENIAGAAFQITRELITNVSKHADASNLSVDVSHKNNLLYIDVSDDGAGFEVTRERAEKAASGHLGLVGVEERAAGYGGTVTISSRPGQGTKAVVILPLPKDTTLSHTSN